MKDILQAGFLQETIEILSLMYSHGWDERNGGNLSYLLKYDEVKDYIDPQVKGRKIDLTFHVPQLGGQYLLVTGSGKYFKNVEKDPADNLGLVKIADDGKSIEVVWGFSGGCNPTSELSAHFRGHIARLEVDKENRIILHCHPANMIALSYIIPQDEKILANALWQMVSECFYFFPEGIGIVPWMVPGTDELGVATAKKFHDFRVVFWPQHGLFSSGRNLDDAFGLLEIVEKAAEIYVKIHSCVGAPRPNVTAEQLKSFAEICNLPVRKEFLE